jgi:hypothetical protein
VRAIYDELGLSPEINPLSVIIKTAVMGIEVALNLLGNNPKMGIKYKLPEDVFPSSLEVYLTATLFDVSIATMSAGLLNMDQMQLSLVGEYDPSQNLGVEEALCTGVYVKEVMESQRPGASDSWPRWFVNLDSGHYMSLHFPERLLGAVNENNAKWLQDHRVGSRAWLQKFKYTERTVGEFKRLSKIGSDAMSNPFRYVFDALISTSKKPWSWC